ncbi:MAG: hypothetical protein KA314_26785, partial [Chloroflexi bacterium]|nr:hypothetical protein [Chloroflexota bacterium]
GGWTIYQIVQQHGQRIGGGTGGAGSRLPHPGCVGRFGKSPGGWTIYQIVQQHGQRIGGATGGNGGGNGVRGFPVASPRNGRQMPGPRRVWPGGARQVGDEAVVKGQRQPHLPRPYATHREPKHPNNQ